MRAAEQEKVAVYREKKEGAGEAGGETGEEGSVRYGQARWQAMKLKF